MTQRTAETSLSNDYASKSPLLETGDVLSREEFERRYERLLKVKKVELIEGIVHMPSPVRWNRHAAPHADMITFLGMYRTYTPGVRVGDNGSLRLDMDNEPQADAAMIIEPRWGGSTRLSEDDFIEGGPELVAEVASSSVSIDLHRKLSVYCKNRVQEYLVWRVLDEEIDWFVLKGNQYEKLATDSAGLLRSEVFPGLWLHVAGMLSGDMRLVIESLQKGLASDARRAWVLRLEARPH